MRGTPWEWSSVTLRGGRLPGGRCPAAHLALATIVATPPAFVASLASSAASDGPVASPPSCRAAHVLSCFIAACLIGVPLYLLAVAHCPGALLVHLQEGRLDPWLTLLNVLPLGGIILWYVLAFAEWKVVPAPQQLPAASTLPAAASYPPQG